MYLYAQAQDMPLSPGILWTKNGRKFNKKVMASQMSFGQIQWLNFIQETDCYDSNGNKIQLEHGYHQGEIEIEGLFQIERNKCLIKLKVSSQMDMHSKTGNIISMNIWVSSEFESVLFRLYVSISCI